TDSDSLLRIKEILHHRVALAAAHLIINKPRRGVGDGCPKTIHALQLLELVDADRRRVPGNGAKPEIRLRCQLIGAIAGRQPHLHHRSLRPAGRQVNEDQTEEQTTKQQNQKKQKQTTRGYVHMSLQYTSTREWLRPCGQSISKKTRCESNEANSGLSS